MSHSCTCKVAWNIDPYTRQHEPIGWQNAEAQLGCKSLKHVDLKPIREPIGIARRTGETPNGRHLIESDYAKQGESHMILCICTLSYIFAYIHFLDDGDPSNSP